MNKRISNKHILGIDPGETGCFCFGKDDEVILVDYKKDKQFNTLDSIELEKEVNKAIAKFGNIDCIYIERQFNKAGQGGGFTNGCNFGILVGVVQRIRAKKVALIAPVTWQKMFGVYKKSKKVIAHKAMDLGFPETSLYGVRGGLKHGRTDAYLLMKCGQKTEYQLEQLERRD